MLSLLTFKIQHFALVLCLLVVENHCNINDVITKIGILNKLS